MQETGGDGFAGANAARKRFSSKEGCFVGKRAFVRAAVLGRHAVEQLLVIVERSRGGEI